MTAKDTTKILLHLRALMRNAQPNRLSAYIIPASDAHSSEYISARDKRRQFVSGFSGSAGTAVVTEQSALLWTDGRYFLQAQQELDSNWQLMKDGLAETPSIGEWLCKNLETASYVGIDTTLYEEDLYLTLANKLRENRLVLFNTKQNLIDLVWGDERPKQEMKPLIKLNIENCGKTCSEKLRSIRDQMRTLKVFATVITSLDETAWLLNLRGFDIPFGTVFYAYSIITDTDVKLFTNLDRLDNPSLNLRASLATTNDDENNSNFQFYEYDQFYTFFEKFVQNEIVPHGRKLHLSNTSNHFVHSLVPNELIAKEMSIVGKMKIVKNASEVASAKKIHIRDSITLTEFLFNMDRHFDPSNDQPPRRDYLGLNEITEFHVAEYLDNLRATRSGFLCPSFETICGFGSNGAVIHYKPKLENANNKIIEMNNMLLVDSGGHYVDMGTTDVTRTIFLGDKKNITEFQRECFTRVLKGHIKLATQFFPVNTRSELLDSFARQALWQVGLDYRHGTGHGVGALLNVHEVPVIGNRKSVDFGLQENMFMTIEPGYYENGQFGIRIENCVLTVKAQTKYKYADFLTFEPLTYVPIQKELIEKSLLDENELEWLNSYHQKCARLIGDELERLGLEEIRQWLLEQTKPL